MTDAVRDANRVTSALGVSSADGVTTLPLEIDSVTGKLLINVTGVVDPGGTLSGADAMRDGNRVTTALAEKDDDTGLASLAVDSRNEYLYIDITFS